MWVKWIIIIACAWWFGRLVRSLLLRLSGGGRKSRRSSGPEAKPKDYKDLTGQKISDADFEEIQEE